MVQFLTFGKSILTEQGPFDECTGSSPTVVFLLSLSMHDGGGAAVLQRSMYRNHCVTS